MGVQFDTLDQMARKQQEEWDRKHAPHEGLPACCQCGDPAPMGENHFKNSEGARFYCFLCWKLHLEEID